MSNQNSDDTNLDENQSSTLKDYLILIIANIKPVAAILVASLIISIIYAHLSTGYF